MVSALDNPVDTVSLRVREMHAGPLLSEVYSSRVIRVLPWNNGSAHGP